MSRSWNRLIHIRLFADGATLEWRRRWPRRVLAREELTFMQPELAPAVAAVAATLDARGWTGPVQVVLGNRWLRFASLPWALQSGNDAADATIAAGWLAQTLAGPGSADLVAAAGWQIQWDVARYGSDRFFVAASADTRQALALLDTPAHPLQQWRPWAMEAWNTCRPQLPSAEGILCVPEAGSLALVQYAHGRVAALQQRAFPSGDRDSLVSLLRLEELRQNQPLLIAGAALPAAWQPALSELGTVLPDEGGAPLQNIRSGENMTLSRRRALSLVVPTPSGNRRHWRSLILMGALASVALLQGLDIAALEQQRQTQQERQEELAFMLERHQTHSVQLQAAPSSLTGIRQQLAIPWQPLLNTLDQAASPSAHLLALSPDTTSGQLRLTIEAATLEAALDYVDRLSARPELVNAHLVSQQPTDPVATASLLPRPGNVAAGKFRFEVMAQWRQP